MPFLAQTSGPNAVGHRLAPPAFGAVQQIVVVVCCFTHGRLTSQYSPCELSILYPFLRGSSSQRMRPAFVRKAVFTSPLIQGYGRHPEKIVSKV